MPGRWTGLLLAATLSLTPLLGGEASSGEKCAPCDSLPESLPLLPVPDCTPQVPRRSTPPRNRRSPEPDYDRSVLYLPETLPNRAVTPVSIPEPEWAREPVRFRGSWFASRIANSAPTLQKVTGEPFIAGESLRSGLALNAVAWMGADASRGLDASALLPAEFSSRLVTPTWTGAEHLRVAAADVAFRRRLLRHGDFRFDGLLGYRFTFVRDQVELRTGTGTESSALARTRFHGVLAGLKAEWETDVWSLTTTSGIGLGVTDEQISQATATSSTHFAVLPSVRFELGRRLTESAEIRVGWDVRYLSRAANTVDNFRQNPETASLLQAGGRDDLLLQGVVVGVEVRY